MIGALDRAAMNWLWIVPLAVRRKVLWVGDEADGRRLLEGHFQDIEAAQPSEIGREWQQGTRAAPYDCALWWAPSRFPAHWGRLGASVWALRVMQGLKHRMAENACLVVADQNPLYYSVRGTTPRPACPSAPLATRYLLRLAGFKVVHRYFVEPSIAKIRFVTPDSPAAVKYRITHSTGSGARAWKVGVALSPARALLFPATLLVASTGASSTD